MKLMLSLVTAVVAKLPGWIAAGEDVYDIYTRTQAVIDANKGPGADEWNALDAQTKLLQAQVRDTSGDIRN